MRTLEKLLTSLGFHRYPQPGTAGSDARRVLYQRRIEGVAPVCRLNDTLHLNVELYEVPLPHVHYEGVEVSLSAELPDGPWTQLKLYSLRPGDIPDSATLERMQARLVAAWLACAAPSAD